MPTFWFIDRDERYVTEPELAALGSRWAQAKGCQFVGAQRLRRDDEGRIIAVRTIGDVTSEVSISEEMATRDLLVVHVNNEFSWDLTQRVKGKCAAIVVMSGGSWGDRPAPWRALSEEPDGQNGVIFARLDLLQRYGSLFLETWERCDFSRFSVPWTVLTGDSTLSQSLSAVDLLLQAAEHLAVREEKIVEWLGVSLDQLRALSPEVASEHAFLERCVPNPWKRSEVLPLFFEKYDASHESNTSGSYLSNLKPTKALRLLRAACRLALASGTPTELTAGSRVGKSADRKLVASSSARSEFHHAVQELQQRLEC